MYIFHKCKPIDEKSYSEKIPLHQKEDYIKKYKLKDLGIVRDYWIQNVFIQSHKHKLSFTYVNDISLHYNLVNNIQNICIILGTTCLSRNGPRTEISA